MKALYTATAALAAFTFTPFFAGQAHAACTVAGKSHAASSRQPMAMAAKRTLTPSARPSPVSGTETEPAITGYWYAQFIADGQVVDDGFDVWHSDGSEVLNDTSTPSSGAVCMGVWTRTGPYSYVLKHPTWIFDDANVNLIAVAVIRESITLDPGGASFTGTASFDVYDLSGALLSHDESDVAATRITAMDDGAPTTPIPGLPASIVR